MSRFFVEFVNGRLAGFGLDVCWMFTGSESRATTEPATITFYAG